MEVKEGNAGNSGMSWWWSGAAMVAMAAEEWGRRYGDGGRVGGVHFCRGLSWRAWRLPLVG